MLKQVESERMRSTTVVQLFNVNRLFESLYEHNPIESFKYALPSSSHLLHSSTLMISILYVADCAFLEL